MRKTWIMGAIALALAGAAAAQPADNAGRGLVRKACLTDIEQLCSAVEPGGGRLGQCLREHQDRVSDTCKEALTSARAARRGRQTPAPTQSDAPPAATGPN